jgi:hypothetical protein
MMKRKDKELGRRRRKAQRRIMVQKRAQKRIRQKEIAKLSRRKNR